jgi:uncharacterized protein YoxC
MTMITPETIKADVEALQVATADAVACMNELTSGVQVSQDQLDNLHAAITTATSDLNAAVEAATPAPPGGDQPGR